MRVLLRADAGIQQGTGHVMRCLTLAEELMARGHDVHLMTVIPSVSWLDDVIRNSGVTIHACAAHLLDTAAIQDLAPDWMVVDSYFIAADAISAVNRLIPTLAVIDGDDRGIEASLFLDQNFGADARDYPDQRSSRILAGSIFALVRNAVLVERREAPWKMKTQPPLVVTFMGGGDSAGNIVCVAGALLRAEIAFSLTIVAPARYHQVIKSIDAGRHCVRLMTPTPELPAILGAADVVVSAAGTSAWDLCTLGVPSVLIAIVDNQSESLGNAVSAGMALGIDVTSDVPDAYEKIPNAVTVLLEDEELRQSLSSTSTKWFDGKGKVRVVDVMEQFLRGSGNIY